MLLDQPGYFDRAVAVHHPVQIYAEDRCFQSLYHFFGIEIAVPHHADGKINDTHPVAGTLKVFGNAGQAYGVHLENGRGRNKVADGTVEYGLLTEVVNARCMEKNEVDRHYPSSKTFARI